MTLFKIVSLLFLQFFLVEHVSSSNAVSRSFKKQKMNVLATGSLHLEKKCENSHGGGGLTPFTLFCIPFE